MARDSTAPGRSGALQLARVIALIGSVVAGLLVIGILLIVLEANPDNSLVEALTDVARWLAGPFRELFDLDDRKLQIAVNWGLAAVVYLAISRLVARLVVR